MKSGQTENTVNAKHEVSRGRRRFLRTGMGALVGALLWPVPAFGEMPAVVTRKRTLWAMGGWHFLEVDAQTDDIAVESLEAAAEAIRRIDRTCSVFDARTPLSECNSSSRLVLPVDDATLRDGLIGSLRWADETSGAFDPTVEPLLHRWGFRPQAIGRVADYDTWDYRSVTYDEKRGILYRESAAIRLDSGAWAKGWAAQRAAETAVRSGASSATVNCGGDLYYAHRSAMPPRETLIRNPDGGRTDAAFRVRHQFPAVATSANTESYRRGADGRLVGHLFDPRTGEPAQSGLVSATVFSHDGLSADAVASALFVIGARDARNWLDHHPDVAAVLLEEGWRENSSAVHVIGPLDVGRV